MLKHGDVAEALRTWARRHVGWCAGPEDVVEEFGAVTLRWEDDASLVEVAFLPEERRVVIHLMDRRRVTGGMYALPWAGPPDPLLQLLDRWGTPTPETFGDFLAGLVAAFDEVYEVRDGPRVRVDPEYLAGLPADRAGERIDWGQIGHEDRLAKIGQALELNGPLPEGRSRRPGRPDVRVLHSVVDPHLNRVAWVQRHVFPPDRDGGEAWVAVWLRAAGDGLADVPKVQGWVHFDEPGRHISVDLVDDHADQVHEVPYLDFLGDAVLAVVDKGHTQLCRLTLRAPGLYGVRVDRVALGGPAVVANHGEWIDPVLCYLSSSIDDTELLMYSLELAGAVPGVPLPVPVPSDPDTVVQQLHTHGYDRVRWVERICHGDGDPDNGRPYGRSVLLRLPSAKQRGYLADPEPLWDRLRAALDGPNTPRTGPTS